jgi:chemotaxis protein CheX
MDHNSMLLAAATSTFEQLGFLFADYELEGFQEQAPLDASARVVFAGPMHGAIEIQLTKALLPELTQNMLGDEDALDEAVWADALGEVANVICGNILPHIAGPEAVFDLASPQVELSGKGLEPYPGPEVSSGILGIEDGRTRITLFVDDAP